MTERLLGLPVRSRARTAACAAALFVFYVLTMSRSLSLYDSPELALVAEQFGLGHPFGQPLHTIVGGLLARLPGVEPLVALNGLSALAGALTVIPATSFAEALVRPAPGFPDGDVRFVAPTIALVGVHPALWEPATRIEVYPLAVFFALWAAARFASAVLDESRGRGPFFATGLGLGLSASANLVCAAVVALAMAPRLVMAAVRREIPRSAIGWVVLGGALGLVTYTYVFAVAAREDVVVWGAPTDRASIAHYFTAADFASKGVSSWAEWWNHVGALFIWSLRNGLLALLVAGFAGYSIYARKRGLGRFFYNATLVFFVALVARNGVFAPDVLDYNGYFAIPSWLAAAGVGLFTAYLAARKMRFGAASLVAVTLLIAVAPPAPHERTRHRDAFTEHIAQQALWAAPPDAILVVERDHWVGPLLYLQEQRGTRPDVAVVAFGLASSGWFWRLLQRRHPDLAPFALRGPNGRTARVRRFLDANSERPVQVERATLAHKLGLRTCPSEWLLDTGPSCTPEPVAPRPAIVRHAAAALAELHTGSPGTDGLIALLTFDRGHDLYVQGFPRTAIASLLAGVPAPNDAPAADLSSVPTRVQPSVRTAPTYQPPVALGHPARNLHYAAFIAHATGATELARYLAGLSDALGPVTPKFASSSASPANL